MDFALDDDQRELASTVRSLLDKRAGSAAVRAAAESEAGYDSALWSALAEQVGVAALAVPEQYDGVGASFFETAVVLEELGRSLAPNPLLATTVAAEALLAGGTEEVRQRLLPRLAAGEIGTLVTDPWAVLDVEHATIVLAVVGDDLVEVSDPRTTWAESMDQTLRLGRADLDAAATTVIGDGAAALARTELVTAAAVAALAVGLCQRALDETVGYAREREQFGRPIGSFQALKHRMADMLVRTEISRSASWAACYALAHSDDAEETAMLVRTAVSYALESAQLVTGEAIQLHGGIAITWEHDAHLWFKRAHALSHLAGAPHRHRAAVTL
ncbi:acyl-CoA dehydrogenase family protein [Nocardioides sambongensis]|uniref:acyl-CoA dehydrogenase family protein n=1 Tax=Nocardioides sambongensis TaxID=2589074 RepID=UPI00112C46B0|nr:acyl-CoA dehydrogenase family protein [Nocardioides sambongensis]